ncbi:MAG TPA: DUF1835 domain-containing protein [Thermoanaerobaculia bacterium]|nr:DUF1835 domain-containing protein [Thermoanaerobaculia bacterium]
MIHIHNGDITAAMARKAGFAGDHIAFREALIGGPVREGDDWIANRARFLSEGHGQDLLRTSNALFEQEQMLAATATQDEIVLWFEHDLFCLIHLLYVLQRVPAAKTYLVWHDHPIGELKPEEMWRVYQRRGAVTADMIAIARDAWKAYTAEDPRGLQALIAKNPREFPFLSEGLALHASRFPSTRTGLGIVDQRILEFIAEGSLDFEALFNRFSRAQPRFGLGDSEILRHLRGLATRRVPLVTLLEAAGTTNAALGITEQGVAVLAGADDIAVNGIDLWLGGVHVTKDNLWRWDPATATLAKGTA